jgi:hypothetical protein
MAKKPTVHEFLKNHGIAPVKPGKIIGERMDVIPKDEKQHFYVCPSCGQAVDKRDLGQVFHHEIRRHESLPTN